MQRFHPGHKFSAKERTADVRTEEQVDFESLLLSPLILKGLADSGFEKPSPIQLKAIPLGRCGLDLIAQAKSGTGKTCVFSVIALENVLIENPATQVLILAPTREIAVQIKDVVNAIGCHMKGLSCQAFIGGLPLDDDKKALKRCHIAVGSPGRVKNLIENKYLKTDSIRMFILDEADKLLDENFQEQINWIFSTLPGNKQMMAFSATYPEYLANHLTRYMREPTFVRLNAADPTLQGIKQFYHVVPFYQLPHKIFQQKVEHLLRLLSKVNFHQCLLFSNFQIRAQSLSSTLCAKGWPATFIAGSQTQEKRLQAMEKLKAFQCRILISTDLTARGIDAENVNLVVNMDVPRDGETYLHRIGRAGRFGTKGVAVTFVAKGKEEEKFREIEKSIGIMMEPLPDHIPDSFMISDSLTVQGQAKQDTVVVNVLHKNMTATTDKDESSRSLISNGKGNVCNGLKQTENHTEHKKVGLDATCDFRDTFVHENGPLSSEVTTHNSNEHSHEQVIKSGLKKNDASGKQEKPSELPSLEEFEKDFEEYLAMASTFEDLGLQDKGEGCQRKQTNCNDQVKETDDHKNKLTNGYDRIDEGADKNKLNTDKASRKLYGICLTSEDRARVNGGVDDLKKDKGENIEDKIENDREDSSDDEDEEDDDGDDVEDDDDDEDDEEEEDDDENDDDNDDNDNDDEDEDDNYEEQDEKEEEKTDQELKCELTNDQSNNSNVLLQIYKKDKNYNDTKTTDNDGHCDSDQQPSVDSDEDKHDDNATDDDDNENDGDEYHDENAVPDDNDDGDESDEDGGDSDEIEDGDGDVNKSGGSKDNNNQEYDVDNLQCESSTNHERYETFDGKQGHGTSQGIESCTAPCHEKSSITVLQCNGAYPADSHGNNMEYCPSAYMYHRTRLMSDYATSEGSGRSGMLSYCMTQGHHALHQGSQYWNNMGNVGYQPSVDDECSSMYVNMLKQHSETSWSNAWHNAYYQVNNAIQQFAAMNSRIS